VVLLEAIKVHICPFFLPNVVEIQSNGSVDGKLAHETVVRELRYHECIVSLGILEVKLSPLHWPGVYFLNLGGLILSPIVSISKVVGLLDDSFKSKLRNE